MGLAVGRAIALVLLVALPLQAQTLRGAALRGGAMKAATEPPGSGIVFARTTGLQTNTTELSRFIALSGSGSYQTDRGLLLTDATAARDAWARSIVPGVWESDGGRCEPVGLNQPANTDLYDPSYIATNIFAMALAGYIEGGTSSFYAAARTHLLELTATLDFEPTDLSGGNQCILDLGAASTHIVESALLLGQAYAGWTADDRLALASWLATEVFPVISWGMQRKNNWGVITYAGALAIAAYADGGIPLLTKWDGSTVTPAAYLSDQSPLTRWLAKTVGNELDSQCDPTIFGLQSYGGFPDELRRTGGVANCTQTSLAFDTTPPKDATTYSQKTTQALTHICEILRRLDGGGAAGANGTRCFDLTTHGGNDEAVYDAAQFAIGSTFSTYPLGDFWQGTRYVAGEFYADAALKAALDDGSVPVVSGRDYSYTRITHAPGVAYP